MIRQVDKGQVRLPSAVPMKEVGPENKIFAKVVRQEEAPLKPIKEAHTIGTFFSSILQVVVDKIASIFTCFFPNVREQKLPAKGEAAHTSTVPLGEFLSRERLDVAARECADRIAKNPQLAANPQLQKIQKGLPLLAVGIQTRGQNILEKIHKSEFASTAIKNRFIQEFEKFVASPSSLKSFLQGADTTSPNFAINYKTEIEETTKFLDKVDAFLKKLPTTEQAQNAFIKTVPGKERQDELVAFTHAKERFSQPQDALMNEFREEKVTNPKLTYEKFLEGKYNRESPHQYALDYPRAYFKVGGTLIGSDLASIEKGNEKWMAFLRSIQKEADTSFLRTLRYQMQTIFTQMLFAKETEKMFRVYAEKGFSAMELPLHELPLKSPLRCTYHVRKEGNSVVLECVRPFKIGRLDAPQIPVGYDAVRISVRIDLSKELNPENPLATPGAVTVTEETCGFKKTLGAIRFK
jgi:hypothetical protein